MSTSELRVQATYKAFKAKVYQCANEELCIGNMKPEIMKTLQIVEASQNPFVLGCTSFM